MAVLEQQCVRVLFHYNAAHADELTIRPGTALLPIVDVYFLI